MYLKNRTITKTCENKTQIEILLRRKPNINNLRLYGSIVFVRICEIKINSKCHKKADIGILVGYENVGYRILVNNKIIIARHVEFIGENDNLVGFQGMDESDNRRKRILKNIRIQTKFMKVKQVTKSVEVIRYIKREKRVDKV